MNKLNFKNIMLTLTVFLLISAPFTSFASDLWSETPDLNHETKFESAITQPATLTNNPQLIDMWAETPDLSEEMKDQGVVIDTPSRLVEHFHQEMYAETPDLGLS